MQNRKKVKIDTITRQQRKLKEVFEKSQAKITDYFLESMTAIIEDHPDIQNTLLTNVENISEFSNISSFLNCLRDTAMKNIKCQKHIDKNFITSNTYTCIEINAHGLLILVEKLRETNQFTPWLCSSQPCKKIFRQIRSMTSTFSTIVNFNLMGILRRLNRVQILNEISTDLSKFIQNINFSKIV